MHAIRVTRTWYNARWLLGDFSDQREDIAADPFHNPSHFYHAILVSQERNCLAVAVTTVSGHGPANANICSAGKLTL